MPTRARRRRPPTASIEPPSPHAAPQAAITSGRRNVPNAAPPVRFMWMPSANQPSWARLSSSQSPTVSCGQRFGASRICSLISAQLGRRTARAVAASRALNGVGTAFVRQGW
jgi:hypothetical protein